MLGSCPALGASEEKWSSLLRHLLPNLVCGPSPQPCSSDSSFLQVPDVGPPALLSQKARTGSSFCAPEGISSGNSSYRMGRAWNSALSAFCTQCVCYTKESGLVQILINEGLGPSLTRTPFLYLRYWVRPLLQERSYRKDGTVTYGLLKLTWATVWSLNL